MEGISYTDEGTKYEYYYQEGVFSSVRVYVDGEPMAVQNIRHLSQRESVVPTVRILLADNTRFDLPEYGPPVLDGVPLLVGEEGADNSSPDS